MGEAEEDQEGGSRQKVQRQAARVGPQLQELRAEIRCSSVSQQRSGRQIEF